MTPAQRGILLLLKSAITGEGDTLPQDFSLEEMAKIARLHQVVPLVYTGALHCGISSKEPVMQSLFVDFVKATIKSEGQLQDLNRVLAAFREHGIDHLPLKGCNMKALYPKPELRTMGDADILIRVEQYASIPALLTGLGFSLVKETDHELIWHSRNLLLELHKHLIPSYNPDYFSYFGNGWRLARPEHGCHYTMKPEDEFIFLFTHFAKHYRDGGAGCRYILDLWVYRRANPNLDEAYIRRELTLLRLGEFYGNISDLIGWWFSDSEATPLTEFLSDFIFSSGVWGQWDSQVLSYELRQSRKSASFRQSRLKSILLAIFPPVEILARRYPAVGKHRWLLPVFWVVRWIGALLFRRENIRRQQDFEKSVAPEHLRARQNALQMVGLDFHF